MSQQQRSGIGEAAGTNNSLFVSLGTALLAVAFIAILTGIVLLPFYHASAEGAHQSVQAIQDTAALRVIRAAHHWASAMLLLLGGAFLVVGVFTHSYRRP